MRATLDGEADSTTALAFGPDGKTLAAGSRDGSIRLWDVAIAAEQAVLRGHTDTVRSLAFGPDGDTLASGGDDTIKLWDVPGGRVTASLPGRRIPVYGLAFSPDGKALASVGNCYMILRDMKTGMRRSLPFPQWMGNHSCDHPEYVAFSADGRLLASGTDETIGLWEVATGKHLASFGRGYRPLDLSINSALDSLLMQDGFANNRIWNVAFTPRGTLLALGRAGNAVRVWRVAAVPTRKS
jgi:WD40 repeat protein